MLSVEHYASSLCLPPSSASGLAWEGSASALLSRTGGPVLFTVHKLSRFASFPSLASPSSVVINFVFLLLARQCSSKLAIALSRSSVRHSASKLALRSRLLAALTFGRACSCSAMLKQAWTLLSLTRSLHEEVLSPA